MNYKSLAQEIFESAWDKDEFKGGDEMQAWGNNTLMGERRPSSPIPWLEDSQPAAPAAPAPAPSLGSFQWLGANGEPWIDDDEEEDEDDEEEEDEEEDEEDGGLPREEDITLSLSSHSYPLRTTTCDFIPIIPPPPSASSASSASANAAPSIPPGLECIGVLHRQLIFGISTEPLKELSNLFLPMKGFKRPTVDHHPISKKQQQQGGRRIPPPISVPPQLPPPRFPPPPPPPPPPPRSTTLPVKMIIPEPHRPAPTPSSRMPLRRTYIKPSPQIHHHPRRKRRACQPPLLRQVLRNNFHASYARFVQEYTSKSCCGDAEEKCGPQEGCRTTEEEAEQGKEAAAAVDDDMAVFVYEPLADRERFMAMYALSILTGMRKF